jgi:proteic killer suppression protein
MIKSFADKDTENLYITGKSRKFPEAVCNVGLRKLDYLNGAKTLGDLRASPGNRLEALKGKYAGKHSIRINDQFRVIFRFTDAYAYEGQIKDYH